MSEPVETVETTPEVVEEKQRNKVLLTEEGELTDKVRSLSLSSSRFPHTPADLERACTALNCHSSSPSSVPSSSNTRA